MIFVESLENMRTKTEKILAVLKVFSYLALIGFAIECGSQIISLIVSFINPDLAKEFYRVNPVIFNLRQNSNWFFVVAMVVVIVLAALKVGVWYRVIQLLSKLKFQTPFTRDVAARLEKIAFQLFAIWIVGVLGKIFFDWQAKITGESLDNIIPSSGFLFIAGIVYIISQIFRRGIEIQEENQLTI